MPESKLNEFGKWAATVSWAELNDFNDIRIKQLFLIWKD